MAEKQFAPRTFPLRVNQQWLDKLDDVKPRRVSKHDYILQAVEEKIKRDQYKKGDV